LQPLIGITTALYPRADSGPRYHRVYAPNVFAVERAGGLPVLIPAGLQADSLRAIYDRLDGLLIPGGGDINPARYGAQAHPLTANIDDARDELEITVARWAAADERPLMGICRGHQLVHVALGGALVQDIDEEIPGALHHHDSVDRPRDLSHTVSAAPDSLLAALLQGANPTVNSRHHQAVGRPAPSLRVVARAPDGVIEASELPNHPFFLAVQWHPEDLIADDPAMLRLFEALVEAARKRARLGRAEASPGKQRPPHSDTTPRI